jgi:sugar (pentulose or hexulose) kinase
LVAKHILVLNLGLKSIRAIVFDEMGNKLAASHLPLNTYIKADWVTQDPNEWWEKGTLVIRDVLRDSDVRNGVKYVTVTASSACLVAVDSANNALGNAIMVSDKRAVQESEYLASVPEFRAVEHRTGLRANPYLMIPKILWLKRNMPDIFERTHKFLSPNDFLLAKLIGTPYTDYFNAQKYHYDVASKSYPTALLRSLEIDPEMFPEAVKPGQAIGTLTAQASALLGFTHPVTAVVTTYDAICAFYGSGPERGEAADVSGTVTSIRVLHDRSVMDHQNRVLTTPFDDYGHYVVGGSNNLGGGLIEWVKQCYYQSEPIPYELMEKEARESQIGAGGLIFLPYLMGERAPLWDLNARGVFFGLERTHTRKDMTRAVFESTGFAALSLLEVMEEHSIPVKRIRVSGGLARINLIQQIKADITGKDILVLDEFETTALGAAVLVGVGQGVFSGFDDASRQMVGVRMVIRPNARNHQQYKAVYPLFRKVYETLKPLFAERIAIVSALTYHGETRIENL